MTETDEILKQAQVALGGDNKKSNDKKKRDQLALDLEGIVDVLDAGDKLVYLSDAGKTIEEATIDGVIYRPPVKKELPYLFPQKDSVLKLINDSSDGSDSDLYARLFAYHKEISDLPDESFYDLLVWWDIHTYFLDRLHFSPILYLYAVKERGKSRTGKGCLYVARRGVFTETVREPDIIRWGNDHRAALGFDVKDFPKKIQRANCDDLLLARFEKGSVSSRTLWPEKGAFRDTKTFRLFGATIVMTNRPVDDILESRCISINMKPTTRQFNTPVLPENALELKALLTAFRFKHRNTKLVEMDKPTAGRLGDILSPLQSVVYTFFPDKNERFQEMVRKIVAQKQDEATDTFEAQVVSAIIAAKSSISDGFLSVDSVASIFNEGKSEQFKVRNETLGRIIRGLGFSPHRITGGKRGYFFDEALLEQLTAQYGLSGISKQPSLPSLVTQDIKENELQIDSDTDAELSKALENETGGTQEGLL